MPAAANTSQDANQVVRVQRVLSQVPPAVDASEQRTLGQRRCAEPDRHGRDRTPPRECRHLAGRARVLAIALGAGEKARHALARNDLQVLRTHTQQFIAAEASPEPEQDQRAIAPMPQRLGQAFGLISRQRGPFEPIR